MMTIDKHYMLLINLEHLHIAQKNHAIDYHRLPRNNITRKNLSITLRDIFPSRGLED